MSSRTLDPGVTSGDGPGSGVDPSQDWNAWSTNVGTAALPVLQGLEDKLPTVQAAMLCTSDGLNLCALGISENDIGHVAALSGTLIAVSGAHSRALMPGTDHESTMVNISTQVGHTVITGLDIPHVGPLLLVVTATHTSLGVMLVSVRQAVQELTAVLSQHVAVGLAS